MAMGSGAQWPYRGYRRLIKEHVELLYRAEFCILLLQRVEH
jgi:hypothetical protein